MPKFILSRSNKNYILVISLVDGCAICQEFSSDLALSALLSSSPVKPFPFHTLEGLDARQNLPAIPS